MRQEKGFPGSDHIVSVTGIVLAESPVGEYDKRVVLLTREMGKQHAFARGARRQNSPLISGTRPFCFGRFELYEGRNSYTLRNLEIQNYFESVTQNMDLVWLGYYFLEFADFYTRENGDEFTSLKLLYQALRALPLEKLDNRLVRCVYELKMMILNGDYDPGIFGKLGKAAAYAVDFIIHTPAEKLFTFVLSEEALLELTAALQRNKNRYLMNHIFKSEEVLGSIQDLFP